MEEQELEVYKQFRKLQDQFCYFLLAVAASAIAFAVEQVKDRTLSYSLIPLASAIVSWALSFFFGIRHIRYIGSALFANMEVFKVARGEDSNFQTSVNIKFAVEKIFEIINEKSKKSSFYSSWQIRMISTGGIMYIIWVVVEMMVRSGISLIR